MSPKTTPRSPRTGPPEHRERRGIGPATRAFRFERLLVGDRWECEVRVEVDGAGLIAAIEPGAPAGGCETVPGWAVPGVPNVHSHSFQRALAGLAEGRGPDSFWSWREVMYAFVERLTPDGVEAITAQLYVEMLKAGFTCVGEFHYLHHAPGGVRYDDPAEMSRRILAAARTAGIGLVHMPVVYERGGFGGEPLEGAQRRFRLDLEGAARMRDELAGDFSAAGARLGWALHSLRAVSRETVGGIGAAAVAGARAAAGAGGTAGGAAPVHIHVSEQEREVRECVERRGARPVEWLLDHAPVDARWCLVHATHMNRDEIAGVAGCGAVVGLCPTTEANLGDGLFPLGAFARAGGRFAIGTDSHVSRGPVEELRLLEYGRRLATRRRGGLGGGARREAAAGGGARGGALAGAGGALLAHAWEDGCRALGWKGGGVAVGKRADVVVLDAEHPALVGREGAAVLDSWIFSGTDNPVRDVMVGGEWMVRAGRHPREEAVASAFRGVVRGVGDVNLT